MNENKLANEMNNVLVKSIDHGKDEPDIVKEYTDSVKCMGFNLPGIKIKSCFIHQRPYAFFVNPKSICGKKKSELGDILYVVKRIKKNIIVDHRGVFIQVKKADNLKFKIEPHQLNFYLNISKIKFKFGNSVYKNASFPPILWENLSNSKSFGNYLMISGKETFVCNPSLIARETKTIFKQFYFTACHSHINNGVYRRTVPNDMCLDSHAFFLSSFFRKRGIGFSVCGKRKDFLKIIYKRIKWEIDPPEETVDYFIEDKRNFGVIEITIDETEQINDQC